jgi:hypothetical protein
VRGAAVSDPSGAASSVEPTAADERAAMRAFLQRCDVRLSTMHRVATALLSGAGILVLLPAVERDSVVSVVRSLLQAKLTVATALLIVAVVLSLVLAIGVLWLVVLELTRFYFHANHIHHDDGEVFTPRFTLTGLRLPLDELGAESTRRYDAAQHTRANLDLIVPANDRARQRIDRQIDAYPGLRRDADPSIAHDADAARAEALFELGASRRRTLIDEVIKVEYGMTRHMLRLQVIILRYVKALLAVVATMLATFVTATAVNDPNGLRASDQRWIAATMAIWAPVVIIVVTSPVRWLEDLLRTEGSQTTSVRNDREFTQLEDFAGRIATVTWLASLGALGWLFSRPGTTKADVADVVAIVVSVALAAIAAGRWRGGRTRVG